MVQPELAPNWRISEWLNTPEPINLEAQRGRVVVACAFQMLFIGERHADTVANVEFGPPVVTKPLTVSAVNASSVSSDAV